MISYDSKTLTKAVAAICPDIQARMRDPVLNFDERSLWWELSSCVLSSQVPYALATAAADAIDASHLLQDRGRDSSVLVEPLIQVLSAPLLVGGRFRCYRFPKSRAAQLAATRGAVTEHGDSLRMLLDRFSDATDARAWLVGNAPGIGPKQASMFLRNVGLSYDLAILDRHVLSYMAALGIYSEPTFSIVGLTQYRKHEAVLRGYAQELDCPVGLLDWAIWIVMRIASRGAEPMPT